MTKYVAGVADSRKSSMFQTHSSAGGRNVDHNMLQAKESELKTLSSCAEVVQDPLVRSSHSEDLERATPLVKAVNGSNTESAMGLALHRITSGDETVEMKDSLDLELALLSKSVDALPSPSIDATSQFGKESTKSLVADSQWLQAL